MGVSGCGKSTAGQQIAAALDAAFLEADALHPATNIDKMSRGIALTDADREPWLLLVRERSTQILQQQQRSCVVACSALRLRYRELLRDVAAATSAATPGQVLFVFLQGSKELILSRMQARKDHFMPVGLLDSQFATLEEPGSEAGVVTVSIAPTMDIIVADAVQQLRSLESTQR